MRLTILGGGGFRVPLVYGALLGGGPSESPISDVVLKAEKEKEKSKKIVRKKKNKHMKMEE